MFSDKIDKDQNSKSQLSSKGFWAAQAAVAFDQKKYSKAVSICKENLKDGHQYLSGKIIYARSLYHSGQTDESVNIFQEILKEDQNNIAALKYLGDIKSSQDDKFGAELFYSKILSIDPKSKALTSPVNGKPNLTTKTITITRKEEIKAVETIERPTRKIPFYTETIGDLYLSQGFPRLAAEVFRKLVGERSTNRLEEKLKKAEMEIKEKENTHVKKTN